MQQSEQCHTSSVNTYIGRSVKYTAVQGYDNDEALACPLVLLADTGRPSQRKINQTNANAPA